MTRSQVSVNGHIFKYILTVQDVFSRYLWLRPLSGKKSSLVASALEELYMDVGPPKVLQSDNGGEFKKCVEKLCKKMEVKIIRGSPYHPQSQGKVERSHRALRKKFAFDMVHLSKSGVNWACQLKEYQKLQNEEPMEVLGNHSPFEVFYGRQSNAALNRVPEGICVRESRKAPQTPKKKDFQSSSKCFSRIRSKAKKASNVWDKRYINRRMKNHPPSKYSVGENVLIRFPFTRTSRSAPKRRYVLQGKVIKRNLKIFRYKVAYKHPHTSMETTSWVSVEDITGETAEQENKKQMKAKEKKSKAPTAKQQPSLYSLHRNKFHIPMTANDVLEEFSSQGYDVVFNPNGDGNCQFSAIIHHLNNIGIFRSPETLREEICSFLRDNPDGVDGTPLELFAGMPWNEYLSNMINNGTYGDQLTLQAVANLYQVKLVIVSSLGPDGIVHVLPQYSAPISSFAVGHFSEQDGIHYVSLVCNGDPVNDVGVDDEQLDDHVGVDDEVPVNDVVDHIFEIRQEDEEDVSVEGNSEPHDDHNSVAACSTEGLFGALPDEILDMIIDYALSGIIKRCLVHTYSRLYNVCKRFRRLVLLYRRRLPKVHMRLDMAPGYHSILSLYKKFGKGSGVILELKDIIDSKKWIYAWVHLLFTGGYSWMYVRNIKWKKKH